MPGYGPLWFDMPASQVSVMLTARNVFRAIQAWDKSDRSAAWRKAHTETYRVARWAEGIAEASGDH